MCFLFYVSTLPKTFRDDLTTFFVFQGVGGRVPRYHMDSLAEILMALNANCVTLLSTWLQV